MRALTLRPEAQADLRAIESFSIGEFGAQAAGAYMDRFEQAFDRLIEFPESAPIYPGLQPPVRCLSVGRHRVFYDYDGQHIVVVRVLHQAMTLEGRL